MRFSKKIPTHLVQAAPVGRRAFLRKPQEAEMVEIKEVIGSGRFLLTDAQNKVRESPEAQTPSVLAASC